jgi:predicted dehydrogenase
LRFGLIGAGAFGALRAAAVRKSATNTLTAVFDQSQEASRSVAGRDAKVYASPESLIEADDVDVVIISTPPQFHEPLAVAAAKNGKHAIVEKPMAPTVDACRRMVQAAADAKKLLTIGFNHRYFPALKTLRDTVQSGELGKLSHVRAFAGHNGLANFRAPWFYDPEIQGGGALTDNGIHVLDLCRYVMGDFREIYGQTRNNVWALGDAEDNAFGLFRNDDGVVCSLHASWTEWKGYRFHVEAYGDQGMARAYYAPMQFMKIIVGKPGGPPKKSTNYYPEAIIREKLKGWQTTTIAALQEEMDDFAALASGRTSDKGRLSTGNDGVRSMEVVKATYASGRSGQAIKLDPLPGLWKITPR